MPLLKQEVREYDSPCNSVYANNFGTISDLADWMEENGVPMDARIYYAGCGTHNIAFVWEREATVEELLEMKRERDKEKAEIEAQRKRGLIA